MIIFEVVVETDSSLFIFVEEIRAKVVFWSSNFRVVVIISGSIFALVVSGINFSVVFMTGVVVSLFSDIFGSSNSFSSTLIFSSPVPSSACLET